MVLLLFSASTEDWYRKEIQIDGKQVIVEITDTGGIVSVD